MLAGDAGDEAAIEASVPCLLREPQILGQAGSFPRHCILYRTAYKEKRAVVAVEREMKHVVRKLKSAYVISKPYNFGEGEKVVLPVVYRVVCNDTL